MFDQIAFCTAWHELPGVQGQLYLELSLHSPRREKSPLIDFYAFWGALKNPSIVLPIAQEYSSDQSLNFERRVFVEVTHAGFWGQLHWKLINRPQAANALAIQAFGIRNKNPCRECLDNYTRYNGGRPDQSRSMKPFFECVSIPGKFDNKCANCMYHENHKCSFTRDEEEWGDHGSSNNGSFDRRNSGGGIPSLIGRDIARTRSDLYTLSDAHRHAIEQLNEAGLTSLLTSVHASGWASTRDEDWNTDIAGIDY